MVEIHLVPKINNREVREVSKCRHELLQLVYGSILILCWDL